jgi:hypothetical protein
MQVLRLSDALQTAATDADLNYKQADSLVDRNGKGKGLMTFQDRRQHAEQVFTTCMQQMLAVVVGSFQVLLSWIQLSLLPRPSDSQAVEGSGCLTQCSLVAAALLQCCFQGPTSAHSAI